MQNANEIQVDLVAQCPFCKASPLEWTVHKGGETVQFCRCGAEWSPLYVTKHGGKLRTLPTAMRASETSNEVH
jgi:hypothetical protein